MITVVRCDYFVNDCGSAKLIEYNLMSVSLTSHSGNIQRAKALTDQTRKDSYIEDDANDLFVRIVSDFYTEKKMSGLFLFVVLQSESNIVDQRLIEAGLLKAEIKCSRATLSQLAKYGKID